MRFELIVMTRRHNKFDIFIMYKHFCYSSRYFYKVKYFFGKPLIQGYLMTRKIE